MSSIPYPTYPVEPECGITVGASPLTIISGGQTGVDRGALDAALAAGVPCGGWCPKGRVAEDGVIREHYPLTETEQSGYTQRTIRNVEDSDGTFVIFFGVLEGGTKQTVSTCERLPRPFVLVDGNAVSVDAAVKVAVAFVRENRIARLNVAGPRASKSATAYEYARDVIAGLLREIRCIRGSSFGRPLSDLGDAQVTPRTRRPT